MKVSFIVDGEPVGKGRPRFTNKGHTYTPKKTVLSEEKVKTMYLSQCGKKRLYGSIRAVLSCFCKIPKSDTKKNRALKLDGKILPAKKPDCDNIAKLILDALNGIAYDDDCQVVELHITKQYAEEPKTIVTLEEVIPDEK